MLPLRASATVSYARAEQDIAVYTGVRVSAKTQQRLVQRQPWEDLKPEKPVPILEMSIDGGNVKLTSGAKDEPEWRQYKAVRINSQGESRAWFQDNEALIVTVSERPLEAVVVCLLYSLEIGTLFTPVSASQSHLPSAGVMPLTLVDPYLPFPTPL